MVDEDEDIEFEDDDLDAGDPFPEDDPGITPAETSMTSTAPEGEQVPDDINIPVGSGLSGSFIALPGGKRVRAT